MTIPNGAAVIADVLGGGYYSDVLLYVVGPEGCVLSLNNSPCDACVE